MRVTAAGAPVRNAEACNVGLGLGIFAEQAFAQELGMVGDSREVQGPIDSNWATAVVVGWKLDPLAERVAIGVVGGHAYTKRPGVGGECCVNVQIAIEGAA
jgi:hypothetical protein